MLSGLYLGYREGHHHALSLRSRPSNRASPCAKRRAGQAQTFTL